MNQSILLFAVLVLVVGCGEKVEAAAPEPQSKAKEAKKAETVTPKESANPWETPTRLALFMAQNIGNAKQKAYALSGIASSLTKAGDKEQALATLKQAVEVAQKIEDAYWKTLALEDIASALAKAGDGKQAGRPWKWLRRLRVRATSQML